MPVAFDLLESELWVHSHREKWGLQYSPSYGQMAEVLLTISCFFRIAVCENSRQFVSQKTILVARRKTSLRL